MPDDALDQPPGSQRSITSLGSPPPPVMSPGQYLRLRREAAGLSLDDVALFTDTWPTHVSARSRAELLALVEQDMMVIDAGLVDALRAAAAHGMIAFDPAVLFQLVAIHAGAEIASPDLCRTCGCSWSDPCFSEHQESCGWARGEADLCTACLDRAVEARAVPVAAAAAA